MIFPDHDEHRIRRQAIASFFSKAKVAGRQDLIQRNVDKLCRRIADFPDGADLNLGAAISAFTRDTAHEFITGKQYNELDEEEFGIELSHASQGGGIMWRTTKHIRWFGPAIKGLPISLVMKWGDEGIKAFIRYLQVRMVFHVVPCDSDADLNSTMAATRTRYQRYIGLYHFSVAKRGKPEYNGLRHCKI